MRILLWDSDRHPLALNSKRDRFTASAKRLKRTSRMTTSSSLMKSTEAIWARFSVSYLCLLKMINVECRCGFSIRMKSSPFLRMSISLAWWIQQIAALLCWIMHCAVVLHSLNFLLLFKQKGSVLIVRRKATGNLTNWLRLLKSWMSQLKMMTLWVRGSVLATAISVQKEKLMICG